MEINKKYVNKVFPDLGLCVCLWSILDCSEGVITFGDGRVHYKLSFQLIVFKPAFDEIIIGRVGKMTKEGLTVSLGFFDNIWISRQACPISTRYEEQTKRLYWAPETTDDDLETEAQTKLYMDEGDPIRFRFLGDEYEYGSAPSAKQKTACAYKVYGSIEGAGCGLTEWW